MKVCLIFILCLKKTIPMTLPLAQKKQQLPTKGTDEPIGGTASK
jgi:hypothetical protein